MPANTAAKPQPQAADPAAVAAQARTLQTAAEARIAQAREALAQAEFDQQRAARTIAEWQREREDVARQREAAQAREAAEAQAQAAQAHAATATARYRAAMTAVAERLEPLAGLIAEALAAEDAVARVEMARPDAPALLRHTRARIADALRVAGYHGGLARHGEFGHPANASFGQQPLSAAFSALPAGLGDPSPPQAPQALSAHAPKPVAVPMPALSPDPVWRGSPFDQPPTPAPSAELPPPPAGFEPLT